MVGMTITPTDEDGVETDGAMADEHYYSLGGGDKSLTKFRPSEDGESPVGGAEEGESEPEVGLSGPYVCGINGTEKINEKAKWMQFLAKAVEHGFKESRLESGNVAEFNGVLAHFKTEESKFPGKDGVEDTMRLLYIDKITDHGGKSKGKSAGGGGKAKEVEVDATEKLVELLTECVKVWTKDELEEVNAKRVKRDLLAKVIKVKPVKIQDELSDLVADLAELKKAAKQVEGMKMDKEGGVTIG